MLHVEWYHVCWPRLTAKRVEPVVSISWASCLCSFRFALPPVGLCVIWIILLMWCDMIWLDHVTLTRLSVGTSGVVGRPFSKQKQRGELLQASVDRECRTCLQRHLSNNFKYFVGYQSLNITLTLTLTVKVRVRVMFRVITLKIRENKTTPE